MYMASSLTPAYIHVAGPSTSHLSITNSIITYTNLSDHQSELQPNKKLKELALENIAKHRRTKNSKENVSTQNSEELTSESERINAELKRIKKHLESKDSKEFETEEHLDLESREQNSKELTKEDQKDLIEKEESLQVSYGQWKTFVQWAKDKGFDLVFALNNEDKNPVGLWDHDSALDILSMAAKANVSDIYWQLGYGKHLFIFILRQYRVIRFP